MKVILISWTNKPIETIYWAFMNMHNKIPDNLDDIKLSEKEKENFLEMLLIQPHQTVLEFVNTVWYLDGVSRAFQQQLTRTRAAAYSIQSLRIVNVEEFADKKQYVNVNYPLYHETMKVIQNNYKKLIENGCSVQDARGILPLNIYSPITMAINLRALYHMLELRFCENTQDEFKEVAKCMKKEIKRKIHPLLAKPMQPICFKIGKCPSPVPCSKYNFEKIINQDISKWIKG